MVDRWEKAEHDVEYARGALPLDRSEWGLQQCAAHSTTVSGTSIQKRQRRLRRQLMS